VIGPVCIDRPSFPEIPRGAYNTRANGVFYLQRGHGALGGERVRPFDDGLPAAAVAVQMNHNPSHEEVNDLTLGIPFAVLTNDRRIDDL
jgi:hypothetical protein